MSPWIDRNLLVTTLIIAILSAMGLCVLKADTRKSPWKDDDQSLAVGSDGPVEIVRICQGIAERLKVEDDEVVHLQTPTTLIFLSGSVEDLQRAKFEYVHEGQPQTATAQLFRSLRTSDGLTDGGAYRDVMEDAVELCVKSDSPPRAFNREAQRFQNELEAQAQAVIRISKWVSDPQKAERAPTDLNVYASAKE